MAVKSDHYTAAGVNIDAGDEMVRQIGPLAASTRIPGAVGGLGGFGAVFDLAQAGYAPGSPRLVSGTDGVGTKLKIAFATDRHDTIGIDCVAMCVNDILVTGARPLFFLDYFATGRLRPQVGAAVVAGIAEGCRQAGCWLAGGETAEMPGMYPDGEYDLAGFSVGAVTPEESIDPATVAEGDVVIALASSGLHSNGYSLARRVLLEQAALSLETTLPGDTMTLGERLLVPTRIYVASVRAMVAGGVKPHAMAHITGGGLWENPQRTLPEAFAMAFDTAAVQAMAQPVHRSISQLGGVPEREMYRVFNMGIGFLITVAPGDVEAALSLLRAAGERAEVVGKIVKRQSGGVELDGLSDGPLA